MRRSEPLLFIFFVLLSVLPVAQGVEPPVNNMYEDGITLTITNKPFDTKAHVIKKCGETVCIIDGKLFYGGNVS